MNPVMVIVLYKSHETRINMVICTLVIPADMTLDLNVFT